MSIDKALYKYEDIEEEVYIETIESHEDFSIVRHNLFCTFKGCTAKIEYRPKGTGKLKQRAHFKTWRKQDHTKDCEDYFEREKKRKSERNLATINVTLSQKHIDRVLRDLYKQANESEEEKSKRLEKRRMQSSNRKKKKNQIIDASQNSNSSVNLNATTEKQANNTSLEKEPDVKKRLSIKLLNDADIDYTRAVHGEIKEIKFFDKQVVITLEENKTCCDVVLEESYFVDAPLNIKNNFKSLKTILERQELELTLSCMGKVSKVTNQYNLSLTNYVNILINGLIVPQFIFQQQQKRG